MGLTQRFAPRFAAVLGAALLWAAAGAPAFAQYTTPERGSETRSGMMDAMRVFAEEELGAPVEFVVYDLRVSGDIGFGAVQAQRPGGGEIDLYTTPGFAAGTIEPDMMDGSSMQALLRRSGRTWVAVHWAIGATDVWFAYAPFCRRYSAVISDYCGQ